MKNLFLIIIGLIFIGQISAQDISGAWNGILKVQSIQLRIVFHLEKTDAGYKATMDSPDQGAKGIAVDYVSFNHDTLELKIEKIQFSYKGVLKNEKQFAGEFTQMGHKFPMDLSREVIEKTETRRVQDPVKPYPYQEENVFFINQAANGIRLAGTLTYPDKNGKHPAVILITGSGAQNRNEEIMGHKPFLVLSDYLSRNGFAVLRYDDRGTSESEGDHSKATTKDLATDVEAAFQYLISRKEINAEKIFLMGHSEGGIIAPIVASQNKQVAGIVLLAGTGVTGGEILLLQQELIGKAGNADSIVLSEQMDMTKKCIDLITSQKSTADIKLGMQSIFEKSNYPGKPEQISKEEYLEMIFGQFNSPWMNQFIQFDPRTALKKVSCPVLAVNGSKDLQVPAKINLHEIEKALKSSGNKQVTTKELPGLNHLFQTCTTGHPSEYGAIEETIAPIALESILQWLSLHK